MLHKGLLGFLVLVMASFALSQETWEKKPYTAWTVVETNNVFDKSPWGRVYTQLFPGPKDVRPSVPGQRSEAQVIMTLHERVLFHLCFATARPIRMAVARRKMLADPGKANPAAAEKYIEQGDDNNIMLLMFLSPDPPESNSFEDVSDAVQKLKLGDLADNTYLSTDHGKKAAPVKYDPYGEDGFGVKIYFPRTLASGPLVTADDKEIRFESVLALPDKSAVRSVKIRATWNLKKMVFGGKLEI